MKKKKSKIEIERASEKQCESKSMRASKRESERAREGEKKNTHALPAIQSFFADYIENAVEIAVAGFAKRFYHLSKPTRTLTRTRTRTQICTHTQTCTHTHLRALTYSYTLSHTHTHSLTLFTICQTRRHHCDFICYTTHSYAT